MTSKFYAHSFDDEGPEGWDPLPDHSIATGNHAARLADVFGCGTFCKATGLLHDIGKTPPEFQELRLYGKPIRFDHSTAGAIAAMEKYGPYSQIFGKAMAFIIAGHHAGLANGLRSGVISSLKDRLSKPIRPTNPNDLGIVLPEPSEFGQPFPMKHAGFSYEFSMPFMTRMMFSCLVDADFLETEKFYAKKKKWKVERGCNTTISEILEKFRSHMAGVMADASENGVTPLNELRAEVLNSAIDAARMALGMYLLTVPTGGGKTFASFAFALEHAVRHGLRRVICVIPYTSIIEQTADVLRGAIRSDDAILEHHSAFSDDIRIRASHGRVDRNGRDEWSGAKKLRLDSQNWDRPIVVTTAVQFFESLFDNRPSRCRKLHNIANSVIVVDEAQTMPIKFLRPCVEALKELVRGYGCSVVLCTATQPALLAKDGFPNGLENVVEIAPNPPELYRRLKRVNVHYDEKPIADDALAGRLAESEKVMCIVNTRRHARDLYGMIAHLPGARHLSTWMCAAHRRDVLARIKVDLATLPVRLISTSLVEAGVDIDFPTVWRAIAGLDSIIQAAGRCNREGKDQNGGNVYVFHPDQTVDGRAPPPETIQYAETAASVLRRHAADPISLDAVKEYFTQLYWKKGASDLDSAMVGEKPNAVPGILRALAEHAHEGDYPYADIADAFRFIPTRDVPIIVPYGNVDAVLKELESAKFVGGISRKLQQFIVQVPPKARDKMVAEGKARVIRQEEFGDQFVVLTQADMYLEDAGLVLDVMD